MKKLNKILAIVFSAVLLLSLLCVTAAADSTATVSLSGNDTIVGGGVYLLDLNVSGSDVGGAEGKIDYDESKFTFSKVYVTSAFAEANRINAQEGTNLINDNGGVISFALLSGSDDTWVTFEFKAKESTGTADFALSDVLLSDKTGNNSVEASCINKTVTFYEQVVSVVGSSIRTNGDADIRFEVERSTDFTGEIAELGVIMIPTKYVAVGQQLTLDEADYSGKAPAIATVTGEKLGTANIVYSNLYGSSSSDYFISLDISARAYVKLTDGTVIYSQNAVEELYIEDGTISRSCVDVARAVAATDGFDNTEIADILAKDSWTVDDYQKVIASNNKNFGY